MSYMVFDPSGLGILSVVNFDVMMSEVHSESSMVTEHPVESGAKISDHSCPNPSRITIEALVTNTPIESNLLPYYTPSQHIGLLEGLPIPLTLQGAYNRWVSGAQVHGGDLFPIAINGFKRPQAPITATAAVRAPVPNIVGGTSLQFPGQRVDRAQAVYSALQQAMQEGLEIQFYTDLREYPSCFISSMSVPMTAEDSLTFSMELVAVSFADSKRVLVKPKVKKPAEKRAVAVQEQGAQATPDLFGDLDAEEKNTNADAIFKALAK